MVDVGLEVVLGFVVVDGEWEDEDEDDDNRALVAAGDGVPGTALLWGLYVHFEFEEEPGAGDGGCRDVRRTMGVRPVDSESSSSTSCRP